MFLNTFNPSRILVVLFGGAIEPTLAMPASTGVCAKMYVFRNTFHPNIVSKRTPGRNTIVIPILALPALGIVFKPTI